MIKDLNANQRFTHHRINGNEYFSVFWYFLTGVSTLFWNKRAFLFLTNYIIIMTTSAVAPQSIVPQWVSIYYEDTILSYTFYAWDLGGPKNRKGCYLSSHGRTQMIYIGVGLGSVFIRCHSWDCWAENYAF